MKKISFILISLLFLINACGPSVEGESKAWDKNVSNAEQAKKDFPNFASVIDTKLEEAKKIWEEAKGITEEEAKAEKMASANNLLSGGCVGNLISMKKKIKDVQTSLDKLEKARRGKEGESKRYADDAIFDAEKAIKKAKEAIAGSSCDEVTSAYKKLSTTVTDLSTALTKINAAEKKAADSTNVNSNNSNNTNTNTTAEPKMVKCEYCDTKNPETGDKCKNCGAPLK